VSLESDDGSGPVRPALSMYLLLSNTETAQIRHGSDKTCEKITGLAGKKLIPGNSVNTYSCSSFARFPSSEGSGPLKLFELMLLKIHQKFQVRHVKLYSKKHES
jgi:hypothetical protein